MTMDTLWAPWRLNYITAKKQKGCFFCNSLKAKSKNQVIFKSKFSFCILNIFPYNNGHLMVSPQKHIKDISLLKDEELLDLMKSVNVAKGLLKKTLNPQGYNIGLNIAKCAGAGITGHIHVHIVPRWHGDTNFMPIIYNTKVMPQSLNELYKLLKSTYDKSVAHQKI